MARHFVAALVCVMVFTCTGTLEGVVAALRNFPVLHFGTSVVLNGFLNFLLTAFLALMVLAPVTSLTDYLFTHKWPLPLYVQVPGLVPVLIAYLLPWSLFFGRWFWAILLIGVVISVLPLLLYWCVFTILRRYCET